MMKKKKKNENDENDDKELSYVFKKKIDFKIWNLKKRDEKEKKDKRTKKIIAKIMLKLNKI